MYNICIVIYILGKLLQIQLFCRLSFESYFPISVVGEKEQSNRTVNVRTRDNKVHGEFTLDAVVAKFNELATERIIKSEEHGWSEKVEEEAEKSKSSTPMSD